MRLTVFGLGYLGLTHAVCMAEMGHDVLGVEIDQERVAKLENGEVPFYEPGLADLLRKHLDSGRLIITTDYAVAADWGELYFIAVGTPQKKGESAADLRYVEAVIDNLAPLVRRDILVLGKSTVPVGTCAKLIPRAADLAQGVSIEIAWNPEFLREGFAVKDTLRAGPPRLWRRTTTGSAVALLDEIYSKAIAAQATPRIVTDFSDGGAGEGGGERVPGDQDLVHQCDGRGVRGERRRCPPNSPTPSGTTRGSVASFSTPGSGSAVAACPRTSARSWPGRGAGAERGLRFLSEIDQINMRRRVPGWSTSRARSAAADRCIGRRIAVLGAAFKPTSDDIRDSPALNVAAQMQLAGRVGGGDRPEGHRELSCGVSDTVLCELGARRL